MGSHLRHDNPRIRVPFFEGPGTQQPAQQVGGAYREVINGPVAAGGTTQALAALVQDGYTRVTGATVGGAAVILPADSVDFGMRVTIKNDEVAAQALPVFPPVGSNINALAANASFSIPTGKIAIFILETATQWTTLPNVAS